MLTDLWFSSFSEKLINLIKIGSPTSLCVFVIVMTFYSEFFFFFLGGGTDPADYFQNLKDISTKLYNERRRNMVIVHACQVH